MQKLHPSVTLLAVLSLICASSSSKSQDIAKQTTELAVTYHPPNGFVPDEATAIRIAEAVWIPIYGKKQIGNECPFHAILDKGIWTVTGSLRNARFGGVATVRISKEDGRILGVIHGK